MADVAEDEAIIVGRVHVKYNGAVSSRDCSVCFNEADCTLLTRSGYVFHSLPGGQNAFVEIRCERDASIYHYRFSPKRFTAPAGHVTYIGDLFVDWKTEGGYKLTQLFGLIGAAVDASQNDGRAGLWVWDKRQRAQRAFSQQTGWQGSLHVSLAGVPK